MDAQIMHKILFTSLRAGRENEITGAEEGEYSRNESKGVLKLAAEKGAEASKERILRSLCSHSFAPILPRFISSMIKTKGFRGIDSECTTSELSENKSSFFISFHKTNT